MPTGSASSSTSRKDGARPTGSWPCGTRSKPEAGEADEPEQYQLFDTPEYTYRVFVTDMDAPLDALVGFYRGRASAENLIKEANNDAGLAAHPSKRWMMNANWFQIVMLAYNLNCWLLLFQREETAHGRRHAAHHAGDGAVAVLVPGGQDLAARRARGREL